MGDPALVIQLRVRRRGYNYDAAVNGIVSPRRKTCSAWAPGAPGLLFRRRGPQGRRRPLLILIATISTPSPSTSPMCRINLVASDRDSFNNWFGQRVARATTRAARTSKLDIIALAITQGVLPELPSYARRRRSSAWTWRPSPTAPSFATASPTDGNAHGGGAAASGGCSAGGPLGRRLYNDTASLNLGAKITPTSPPASCSAGAGATPTPATTTPTTSSTRSSAAHQTHRLPFSDLSSTHGPAARRQPHGLVHPVHPEHQRPDFSACASPRT